MEINSVEIKPGVTMLEIKGPMDPMHPVMVKARSLVLATGSPRALDAFDTAVRTGTLLTSHDKLL